MQEIKQYTLNNGIKEVIRKIKKYIEMNENENPTCQNLWCRESSTREKFVAVNSYIKKERYQINNPNVYLKELERK